MLRVAVAGVHGRMGRLAAQTVGAAADLEVVGGFARNADPERHIYSDFTALLHAAKPDVVVDFTTHPITVDIAHACIVHGVSPVIGSSAWTPQERDELAAVARAHLIGSMLVPNFAVGAVLLMQFAQHAARFFPSVEIVEMHRAEKLDKPSGTARALAERIGAVTHADVPIHSVRLHGVLAHHEAIFGNTGETFALRHDSLTSESFAQGILLAVRAVRSYKELVVGIDALVEAVR